MSEEQGEWQLLDEMMSSYEEFKEASKKMSEKISEKQRELERLKEKIERKKEELHKILAERLDLDEEKLDSLIEHPYTILPKSEDQYWLVVPRAFKFRVGWLERQTESYNIFAIDRYVQWITDLPEEIKERIGMKPFLDDAWIEHREGLTDILHVPEEDTDRAYDRYSENLYARKKKGEIKVHKGKEFQLIADLIDDGVLPFRPQPIEEEDLRSAPSGITLKPFQKRAWEKFKKMGALGVFWAPGSGKTFFSLYAGERIKGKKLVVVPTNTLKEQWRNRIKKFCRRPQEWEVQTYHYIAHHHLPHYQEMSFALTVFDEVHHLPAPTFSKLATLRTKHRLGLSASPFREDGKTNYIFALTGYPVGLKWQELIELGVIEEPTIYVYLYRTQRQKRMDLGELINVPGKILVYCDSISRGKNLAKKYDLPFVYGETRDRMEKFRENRVVIGSRVADEGISIGSIDRVVEFDFLGGSRRQEAQRMGRLMHGDESGKHIVMMTDEELRKYEKRLYAIEEQGFRIRFERRR